MGRNVKQHHNDSAKHMLKAFKEEIRRNRKRQNELVKHFKCELREYKKHHPNNINKNFERALRRLQKEDAEKSRWRISSLFQWARGKNVEKISWDDSDTDQSELEESHCPVVNKGKVCSTITSAGAIYCRSDFFEDSQHHGFKWVHDIQPAKKGHKRTASEVEVDEDCKYCKCKSPKMMRKSPKVVAERSSCEKRNPGNISLCSSIDESASSPEFIACLKELNDSKSGVNSLIEKRVVRLRNANGESHILVMNMPSRCPLNCEANKHVDGNGEGREKHRKKRKKYRKPES